MISRWASLAALLVGTCLFVAAYVDDLGRGRFQDFAALWDAAYVLDRGDPGSLYAHDPVDFGHVARGSQRRPFVQPPIVAEAVRAALPIGFNAAGRLVGILDLASLLLAGALLLRSGGWARPPPLLVGLALAGLAYFEPMRLSVSSGQTTPIAFLGAVLALEARDDRVAGGGLALAAVLKGSPILLGVVLLAQRRWRALGWTASALGVAAVASLLLCGVPACASFLGSLGWMSGVGLTAFVNQSATAVALRAGAPLDSAFSLTIHPLSVSWRLATGLVSLAALAGAFALHRRSRRDDRDGLLGSFVTLLVLLAPAISWSHYYLLALVPVTHLGAQAWRRGEGGTLVAVAVASALMIRPLAPAADPLAPTGNFFASGFAFAAAILLALVVVRGRAGRPLSFTG